MLGYSMPKPYAMLALSLTGLLYPWSGAGVTRSFALSCVHLFSRFREPPSRAFGSILKALGSGGGRTFCFARSDWARLRVFETIPRQSLERKCGFVVLINAMLCLLCYAMLKLQKLFSS